MGRLRQAFKPYFGTRNFYRNALAVMLPVTVQQLINNLFNMVDNIMVGSLDIEGLAMSAVTVANKPYLVFFGFFYGLTGAAGLMISQYYGSRDKKSCQGLFSLQMVLGLGIALVFFALLKLFPKSVMNIFVSDERTVALGVDYLSIVCYSYLPVAVSNVCVFSMRALGHNKASMYVSLATMGVNALCNYMFIFGKLGMPCMGVRGAALGTLIARLFEMGFYLVLLAKGRTYFSLNLRSIRWLRREQLSAFITRALPLIGNELLFTVGNNIFFWCYARMDETALPAITIADLAFQISAVLAVGTSAAVSVLIGAELGAGELEKAKNNSKKLLGLTLMIGLCCMTLCIGAAFALPLLFTVSQELRTLATQIACLQAVLCPISFLSGFSFCCLRAGGDTRHAMMMDSGYMWVAPVPLSLLLGFLAPGKLSVLLTVMLVMVVYNLKSLVGLHLVRKGEWVRNLTQA